MAYLFYSTSSFSEFFTSGFNTFNIMLILNNLSTSFPPKYSHLILSILTNFFHNNLYNFSIVTNKSILKNLRALYLTTFQSFIKQSDSICLNFGHLAELRPIFWCLNLKSHLRANVDIHKLSIST